MSLSEVLAEAQSGHCLQVIAQRYRLTADQAQQAVDLVRPLILRQISASLSRETGATDMLRALAQPALAQIDAAPQSVVDQDVRLAGDSIHRQLARHDGDLWTTLDGIARTIGISHQTLRAMMPSLTLMILGALRRAATPVFLRFLMQERPDDTSTDPYVFAQERAEKLTGRTTQPATALRWLDLVLSRTGESRTPLRAEPSDRIS